MQAKLQAECELCFQTQSTAAEKEPSLGASSCNSGHARMNAYCQLSHVHDHPLHVWSLPQVLGHHLFYADLAKIYVCDVSAAGVISAPTHRGLADIWVSVREQSNLTSPLHM